jgi:hypothetical protein
VIDRLNKILPRKWVARGLLALYCASLSTHSGRAGELNMVPEKPEIIDACVPLTIAQKAQRLIVTGVLHTIPGMPLHPMHDIHKTRGSRPRGADKVTNTYPPLGRAVPSELHKPGDITLPLSLLPDKVIGLRPSKDFQLPVFAAAKSSTLPG